MNKTQAVIAVAFVALSTTAFAQDSAEAARQQRMDEAYATHRDGPPSTLSEDTHRAGHAIHNGVRETGHAIHRGVRATGHAIHNGVRATGHAIHHGVDKVTGK
jgi:Ni/Co efflux regulator RcnB